MANISTNDRLKEVGLSLPQMIEILASFRMTYLQIGEVFGVTEKTVQQWTKDEEIKCALKKGKEIADSRVERSLYERAVGYTHPEEKIFQHEGKAIRVETLKHYPPDPVSCIFWLKNRKPDQWREKKEGGDKHTHLTIINKLEKSDPEAVRSLVESLRARVSQEKPVLAD